VILDPHLESDQYQNLSTSKGSTLGHNLQTLVDINEHIYELPLWTDRQTDTHKGDHNTCFTCTGGQMHR